MEKNSVELTSIQASAYWFVNMIRNKVRELHGSSHVTDNECSFLTLFYAYNDSNWRNIYLGLVEYFEECVSTMEGKVFSLDTEAGGHDNLNTALTAILNQSVPDISLSGLLEKDSVIYMNNDRASVWYKSCGEMPLSLQYDSEYVLTGNEDELELYNVFVATISMLGALDSGFRSVPELRERFCKEYKSANGLEEELQTVIEKFNLVYKKAIERGLVYGPVCSERLYTSINSMDIAALDDYMDKGHHYAEVVLQRDEIFPLPVSNKLKKENKE